MSLIILIILLGIVLGAAWRRHVRVIAAADRLSGLAVLLLLFLLGVAVGRDEAVMANLGRLGLMALGFSLFAMVGSIAAVRLIAGRHDAQ